VFGFGAPDFDLKLLSYHMRDREVEAHSVQVVEMRNENVPTHLLGLKASIPTSSYFLVALFASCFSSSAT
jgi:hypothetical protein